MGAVIDEAPALHSLQGSFRVKNESCSSGCLRRLGSLKLKTGVESKQDAA